MTKYITHFCISVSNQDISHKHSFGATTLIFPNSVATGFQGFQESPDKLALKKVKFWSSESDGTLKIPIQEKKQAFQALKYHHCETPLNCKNHHWAHLVQGWGWGGEGGLSLGQRGHNIPKVRGTILSIFTLLFKFGPDICGP